MVARHATRAYHHSPDAATVTLLQSKPWSAALLADPTFTPIRSIERDRKPDLEDTLLAETLNTPSTIHTWQAFYRPGPPSASAGSEAEAPIWGELRIALALGGGANGHPGIAHGGLTATVLDVVVTMLAEVHRGEGAAHGYTARLSVDFRAPVPTPGLLLATARLLGRSGGRKAWVVGSLEDGEGRVFAEAEGLVVETRERM